MRKRLLLVLAVTVAAATMVGGASATLPPGTVSPIVCNGGGAYAEVPAGVPITLQTGWLAKNRGLARLFRSTVTTDLAIDGSPVANADSYFAAPEKVSGGWQTNWIYPTGITLGSPGDTMTLSFDWVFSHPLVDGVTYIDGKLVRFPAGDLFGAPITCTITAVAP